MFSSRSLKRIVTVSFVAFLFFAVMLLAVFYGSGRITFTDSLLYLSESIPLVLGFMGVLVAVHEEWAKAHHWIVIIAFIVVSLLGFGVSVKRHLMLEKEASESRKEATEANKQLSTTLDKINNQSAQIIEQGNEISRVQGLNTELQNKLLGQSGQLVDSSKQIAALSKEAISTTTGGETFCAMDLVGPPINLNGSVPIFVTHGKYPLYDVHARLIDVPKLEALAKTRKLQLFEGEINLELGDLTTTVALIPPNAPVFQFGGAERYQIVAYFNARNGTWREDYQMRRVGNHYARAIRVFWQQQNGKDKLVYDWSDEEYPKK